MNAHTSMVKEIMIALPVATILVVVAITATIWLLRRKLVG